MQKKIPLNKTPITFYPYKWQKERLDQDKLASNQGQCTIIREYITQGIYYIDTKKVPNLKEERKVLLDRIDEIDKILRD